MLSTHSVLGNPTLSHAFTIKLTSTIPLRWTGLHEGTLSNVGKLGMLVAPWAHRQCKGTWEERQVP